MPTAVGLLLVWLCLIYVVQILGNPPIDRKSLHLPTRALEEKQVTSINFANILSPKSSVVVLLSMAFGVLAMLEAMNLKFGVSNQQEQHHKQGKQKEGFESELEESKNVLDRTKQEGHEVRKEVHASMADHEQPSASIVEAPKIAQPIELDCYQSYPIWMKKHHQDVEDLEADWKEFDKKIAKTETDWQQREKNIYASLAGRNQTSASIVETPKTAKSIQLERDQARAASAEASHIIHLLRQKETLLATEKMGVARQQLLNEEFNRLEYLQNLELTKQLEYMKTIAKKQSKTWRQKLDRFNVSNDRFEQSLQRLQQEINWITKNDKGSSSAMQLKAPCGCTCSAEERAKLHAAELQRLYEEARALLQSRQPLAKAISKELDEAQKRAKKVRALIDEFVKITT